MTVLVVGALLALGAFAWVLLPLLSRSTALLVADAPPDAPSAAEDRRELALDVAAGRLSREEFERLTAEEGEHDSPDRRGAEGDA